MNTTPLSGASFAGSDSEQVREALKEAIRSCNDSQSELARRMSEGSGRKYVQQHISHWLKVGRIPAEHAGALERVSGVSRHRFCPGVFEGPTDHAA